MAGAVAGCGAISTPLRGVRCTHATIGPTTMDSATKSPATTHQPQPPVCTPRYASDAGAIIRLTPLMVPLAPLYAPRWSAGGISMRKYHPAAELHSSVLAVSSTASASAA